MDSRTFRIYNTNLDGKDSRTFRIYCLYTLCEDLRLAFVFLFLLDGFNGEVLPLLPVNLTASVRVRERVREHNYM